jgi:hypothetical protein
MIPHKIPLLVFGASLICAVSAYTVSRRFFAVNAGPSFEKVFEVGRLCPLQKLTGAVQVANDGSRTLTLRPFSRCACLPITMSNPTLLPQERTLAIFSLIAPSAFGNFENTVAIYWTDGEREGIANIQVKGNVANGIECIPERLSFHDVPWGSRMERRVEVRTASKDAQILSVVALSQRVSCALQPSEGGRARIVASVQHPFSAGDFSAALVLHTSDTDEPYRIIPVHASFAQAVSASPPVVLFRGGSGGGDGLFQKVEIRTMKTGSLKVDVPPDAPPFAHVKLQAGADANCYNMTVDLSGSPATEKIATFVTAHYQDEQGHHDELKIPIYRIPSPTEARHASQVPEGGS